MTDMTLPESLRRAAGCSSLDTTTYMRPQTAAEKRNVKPETASPGKPNPAAIVFAAHMDEDRDLTHGFEIEG